MRHRRLSPGRGLLPLAVLALACADAEPPEPPRADPPVATTVDAPLAAFPAPGGDGPGPAAEQGPAVVPAAADVTRSEGAADGDPGPAAGGAVAERAAAPEEAAAPGDSRHVEAGRADPRGRRQDLSTGPEAVSLLGTPLYPRRLDPATESRLLAQLDSAQAAYDADPEDADALIWLGRRLAYVERYREAIDAFTEGIERHPADARFYRHRGHRLITVREFDRAIADLEHAARLVGGEEDVVEEDGQPNAAGIPRSTLQTNIWYHLGLARYLSGDFYGAAYAFDRGLLLSRNDDMRVAMADWLWLSLRRQGRDDEAAEVLQEIDPEMQILENHAYHRRLLMYKGVLPPDSVLPGAANWFQSMRPAPEPLAVATSGYGVGAWHLLHGDDLRARRLFRAVLETGYWPAFGYIAAEAEMARLGPPPTPAPR